jgi:hypothetical protein
MLKEKAMLASLSIRGIWTAVAEDERVTAEVAQRYQVESSVGRYMKRVCDPKKVPSLRKLNQARTDLYNIHRRLTLPWDDKGTRLLPAEMYFEYTRQVQEAKQAVLDAYEQFLYELPELKRQARIDLNGLFREEDWPEPETLRRRLEIRVKILPFPDENDFRVSLGDEEVKRIREQITQDIYQSVAVSVLELVQRLRSTVTDMYERISRYDSKESRSFKDTAVTNLRELLAIVPKLNVIGAPEINQICEELEQKLCQYDAQELRDNYLLRKKVLSESKAAMDRLAAVEQVLGQAVQAA